MPSQPARARSPTTIAVRWKLHGIGDVESCTVIAGSKPALLHAIEAALEKLRGKIGAEVVDEAVRVASAYSTAELDWLADWCERHAAPETITESMAAEALQQRRANACVRPNEALLEAQRRLPARSRAAAAVLGQTQLLLAQQRALSVRWQRQKHAFTGCQKSWNGISLQSDRPSLRQSGNCGRMHHTTPSNG